MTATYPDISRFLDLRPRSRARVEQGMRLLQRRLPGRWPRATASRCSRASTTLPADERDTFAEDGFHPSPEGHRRAAAAFLRALRGDAFD